MLVIDGPFEVNFEEIFKCFFDEGKDKVDELTHQIWMSFQPHIEKIETNILLAENLIDKVLAVIPETFVDEGFK